MQFASVEYVVKSVFLYKKNLKVIKQTIVNILANKGIVNLIKRMKKDNDSQRQTLAFMTL